MVKFKKGDTPEPVDESTPAEVADVLEQATADEPELQDAPSEVGNDAPHAPVAEQGVGEEQNDELAQHPADPALEVAKRAADNVEPVEGGTEGDEPTVPSIVHRKVFVLVDEHVDFRIYNHDANIRATRQEMIQKGLRPVGDVKYVGTAPHGDGASVDVIYEGKAVPAYTASAVEVEHAHADQNEGDLTPAGVTE